MSGIINIILGGLFFVLIAIGFKESLDITGASIISFIGITLSIYVARRYIDRRSFMSLGLNLQNRVLIDILMGFFIAGMMIGAIFLIELLLGWLTIEGYSWKIDGLNNCLSNCLSMLFFFVLIGWQEELWNRGYILQNIVDGTNRFWGVLLSSVIFSSLHLFNPNFSYKAFLGLFISGIFLAFPYIKTGQLWVSIGLHIGWNFFEGTVFGFSFSGMANVFPIIIQKNNGPEIFTGGLFGPEAGLVLIPGIIIGFILTTLYINKLRIN